MRKTFEERGRLGCAWAETSREGRREGSATTEKSVRDFEFTERFQDFRFQPIQQKISRFQQRFQISVRISRFQQRFQDFSEDFRFREDFCRDFKISRDFWWDFKISGPISVFSRDFMVIRGRPIARARSVVPVPVRPSGTQPVSCPIAMKYSIYGHVLLDRVYWGCSRGCYCCSLARQPYFPCF